MWTHLGFAAAVLAAGAAFALLEIQVEGRRGWAAELPTWRTENAWTRALLGGRPLTGYHLWAHATVLVFAHLPLLLGFAAPSWAAEARIAGFLVLFWVAEDFLWFALNPAFGVRRFRPEHVPWHAHAWWGIMPREYWLALPSGVALYLLSL